MRQRYHQQRDSFDHVAIGPVGARQRRYDSNEEMMKQDGKERHNFGDGYSMSLFG